MVPSCCLPEIPVDRGRAGTSSLSKGVERGTKGEPYFSQVRTNHLWHVMACPGAETREFQVVGGTISGFGADANLCSNIQAPDSAGS